MQAEQRSGLPAGRAVVWDDRVRLRGDASVVLGGAPWGLLRIAPAGRPFLRRLRAAGTGGLVPDPGVEQTLTDLLLKLGIVHPVSERAKPEAAPDIIVPAYERPELLAACLDSLRRTAPDSRIIVVDDASASPRVAQVARARGATLIRHKANLGPSAARNTGLREVSSPVVVFVDADCVTTDGWLGTLMSHFDDPRVAAVAPRITARTGRPTLLARYEATQSALDMGPRPELVTHGAPLGYLPSAALAVRRDALTEPAFDPQLRVGEDVDLIWRLVDANAIVRYEPAAVVTHEMRPTALSRAGRIFAYGTSAAELDRRHPGRLAPARLSFWNVTSAALLLTGHPAAAATLLGIATVDRSRRLRDSSMDSRVAGSVMVKSLTSDTAAAGHLLRREWWPIGWLALAAAPRSRLSRLASIAMLIDPVSGWLTERPQVDLPRYLLLRLAEDAVYGSGVIVSAWKSRRPKVLLPLIHLPRKNQKNPKDQKNP